MKLFYNCKMILSIQSKYCGRALLLATPIGDRKGLLCKPCNLTRDKKIYRNQDDYDRSCSKSLGSTRSWAKTQRV
jgi:hypothetical protein